VCLLLQGVLVAETRKQLWNNNLDAEAPGKASRDASGSYPGLSVLSR